MKRILVSLGIVLGLVTASSAAIPVPKDAQNAQVSDPRWAGASVCDVGTASGTANVLCATGKGVIFAVLTTSGTSSQTGFVTVRDSATANSTSTALIVVTHEVLPFMSVKFVNGLSVTASAGLGTNEHISILYRLQSDQN